MEKIRTLLVILLVVSVTATVSGRDMPLFLDRLYNSEEVDPKDRQRFQTLSSDEVLELIDAISLKRDSGVLAQWDRAMLVAIALEVYRTHQSALPISQVNQIEEIVLDLVTELEDVRLAGMLHRMSDLGSARFYDFARRQISRPDDGSHGLKVVKSQAQHVIDAYESRADTADIAERHEERDVK